MVFVCPLISKSSSPFTNNPSVVIPRVPITFGINVTFMFHSFFNSKPRSTYFSFFSLSFNFTLWSARTAKFTILQVLFFLLIIIRSGCLAEIKWSVCMSKPQRSLCVSFSRTDVRLYIYHLFVILFLWTFFAPALADGFSLEFEWQKVSSSLQESSQHSGRS